MNSMFVYGTLMEGMDNYHFIRPFVRTLKPGIINGGTLYHLNYGYPALLLTGGQTQVRGEIIELRDMEKALPVLDQLEDYYGEGCPDNLYDRVICQAVDEHGNTAHVYVYVWSRPEELGEIGQLVRSGCWRKFLAQHR